MCGQWDMGDALVRISLTDKGISIIIHNYLIDTCTGIFHGLHCHCHCNWWARFVISYFDTCPIDKEQQQQQQQQQTSPFGAPTQYQPQVPQATGTNPFVRRTAAPEQASPGPPNALQVQPTGSTNPFRQSQFVNQQSGVGWQHGPQGTLMGLESLETVPVFPRPSGGGGQFSQPQQSPWAV